MIDILSIRTKNCHYLVLEEHIFLFLVMSVLNFSELNIYNMNNAGENGQYEEEEESLYIPNWFVEVMESIKREEMISRGICTTNRLFHQLCWPKLHGKVEPHRIEYLEISYNFDRNNPFEIPHAIIRKGKLLEEQEVVPIPQVEPPPYITGFECIDLSFLDEQILEFMRIIVPLLKNCTIKCEMFMGGWKTDEKQTQQLRKLFMMILLDGRISMLSFAENRFSNFQQLFPEIIDQVEGISIEERNNDFEFLLNWLMKNRNDGGQKILNLGGNGMRTTILDRIKNKFSTSTCPANFLIWQQNFEHDKFKIENSVIGEILELYANSKGQCFLARFPKGEDHWKEIGEKKIFPRDDDESSTKINFNIEIKSDAPYIDSIWEVLRVAIQKILEKDQSFCTFEKMYRYQFIMVSNNHGQKLYNGIKEIVTEHLQTKIREQLSELIDKNNNEQFIAILNKFWQEYTLFAMKSISEICLYLERTCIRSRGLMLLQHLGLHLFKTEIVDYPPINQYLKDVIFGGNSKGKIDNTLFDFLLKHI